MHAKLEHSQKAQEETRQHFKHGEQEIDTLRLEVLRLARPQQKKRAPHKGPSADPKVVL